jgi:hypothetical protein
MAVDFLKLLRQHSPGCLEENHKESLLMYSASQLRLELGTCQIQVRRITASDTMLGEWVLQFRQDLGNLLQQTKTTFELCCSHQ